MAGLRKNLPFRGGSADPSYPPLCCPSGSVSVRDESQRFRTFAALTFAAFAALRLFIAVRLV
jgi:hypothetical protein